MYKIEGRRVFVATGNLTQTVNICDANNVQGRYQWTVRVPRNASPLQYQDLPKLAKVKDLIAWLEENREGLLEEPVESAERDSKIAVADVVSLDAGSWIGEVETIIEGCIDGLVHEFVSMPYLHRVEHSMHVRLMEELRAHNCLAARVPIGGSPDNGLMTQLVHKEWPETIPRRELKGDRRGNFDIGILSPESVTTSTLDQFRDGRIRPAIAIEMGVDYSVSHLLGDAEKLINSRIPKAYIVHLDRTRAPDERLADAIKWTENHCDSIRVAVGIVRNGRSWKKAVRDATLTTYQRS